jgi:hypothetical protein
VVAAQHAPAVLFAPPSTPECRKDVALVDGRTTWSRTLVTGDITKPRHAY